MLYFYNSIQHMNNLLIHDDSNNRSFSVLLFDFCDLNEYRKLESMENFWHSVLSQHNVYTSEQINLNSRTTVTYKNRTRLIHEELKEQCKRDKLLQK